MRRKGYAEVRYEAEVRHAKKRARQRTMEAVAVIGTFGGLAFVFYYLFWMWCNGLLGA